MLKLVPGIVTTMASPSSSTTSPMLSTISGFSASLDALTSQAHLIARPDRVISGIRPGRLANANPRYLVSAPGLASDGLQDENVMALLESFSETA
jgi:hypothetical protein